MVRSSGFSFILYSFENDLLNVEFSLLTDISSPINLEKLILEFSVCLKRKFCNRVMNLF